MPQLERPRDSQEDTGSYFAPLNFSSSADPLSGSTIDQGSPPRGLGIRTEPQSEKGEKTADELAGEDHKISSFFNRWWGLELLACVASAITLVAIVLVLRMYDGEPLPEWPLELSLNAVLSILSIVIRSTLALPLAQATSQLKWLWFRKERALADLQTFDEASRGQSGAVKLLLFTTKGSHLASLGSLVTLATIALGPIIQQLVGYDTRPVPTLLTGLAVPRSETWTINTTESGGLTESAISRGFYYSGNDSMPFSTPPSCPTTECTWDVFNSLAVTHKCTDMADVTEKQCWQVTSRPHLYCNFTVADIELLNCRPEQGGCSTGTYYTVDEDQEMDALSSLVTKSTIGLLTFAAVTYTEDEEQPEVLDWRTLQCQMQLSVNKYEPNTTDGVYSETIIASAVDDRAIPEGWIQMYQGSGTERFDMEYLKLDAATMGNDTDNKFGLTGKTRMTLLMAFENLFGIRPTSWSSAAYQNPDQVQLDAAKVFGENGSLEEFPAKAERFVANMALSLTNNVRTTGDGDAVLGDMLIQETFVHVRWWWLFFPGVLQVLTVIYLVATMLQSRRAAAPAWKSSSLAVFRFGMISQEDRRLVEARELVTIENIAGRTKSKID